VEDIKHLISDRCDILQLKARIDNLCP